MVDVVVVVASSVVVAAVEDDASGRNAEAMSSLVSSSCQDAESLTDFTARLRDTLLTEGLDKLN